jgi:LPXTG-site transpeptidase (sortase) family protein
MNLDSFFRWFGPIWDKKWPFLGVFFVVVLITYAILVAIDFIPEEPKGNTDDEVILEEAVTVEEREVALLQSADETPDKIIIDALNKEIAVLNPASASVAALDHALLSGVVRHPHSSDLFEEGTVFLFGHSSYLPNVINKNFQAFNGIEKLEWGDTIRLQSADFEYVYRVDRVYEVKASTAEVKIATKGKRLTLVTCDTFGAKEDRFVVEATLIDSYSL